MDIYIAEVSFADSSDLPRAIIEYNAKASKFQSGLSTLQLKYKDFLVYNKVSMGVETIDNLDNCIIKLKSLSPDLPQDIQSEIIELFSTTWSQ